MVFLGYLLNAPSKFGSTVRILGMSNTTISQEDQVDRALRPTGFDDFAGQESVKQNLCVFVRAARARGEALDHTLFCGPPGTGKTTLAGIVAAEMKAKLVVINCASLKSKGELARVICGLERGDVLFLDEVHSLKPDLEEMLYPVMEDSKIEIAGEVINFPRFTIIGATTRAGMLSHPFLDRFGEICSLELYKVPVLARIVKRSSELLGLHCSFDAYIQIAKRSKGTPRIALKILRRVRDFAQVECIKLVDSAFVIKVATKLGIDETGLDKQSQKFLSLLASKNRPVGLSTVAAYLNESKETVEENIEPYLLSLGMIERMPSGRTITDIGKIHLKEILPSI